MSELNVEEEHALHPVLQHLEDDRTFGERIADHVVAGIGTWKFLIIQSCVIIAWILLRVLHVPIDNPQLTILNLCLSVQAAMTGPLLLLAGNRQQQKDRELANNDFEVNETSLELLKEAHRLVTELHKGEAPPKVAKKKGVS